MISSISSLNLIYKITSVHILVKDKSAIVSLEVCTDNEPSALFFACTSLAARLTIGRKLPMSIGHSRKSGLLKVTDKLREFLVEQAITMAWRLEAYKVSARPVINIFKEYFGGRVANRIRPLRR